MPVAATDLAELATEVAIAAGALLLDAASRRRAGEDLDVDHKTSASDPVSDADRGAERLIAERLLAARPDDGLLGEEGQAERASSSGIRWVVDPLDGTVNFLYGLPSWCVSIAAEDERGGLAGVVHDPSRGESFVAVRDGGAHRRDTDGRTEPLAVTAAPDLARSLVATGFAYRPEVRAVQGVEVADLLTRVRDVRRGGAAALDLAWCAAGRLDGYLEFGLQPWDWAAGRLLVTEAGGVVTEHAQRLAGVDATTVVAGGAATHAALRTWLEGRA